MKTIDPKNPTLEEVAGVANESMSIELAVAQNPVIVFNDPQKLSALYGHIEREVAEFVPDSGTDAGRKKIAALAYKVARTKTALDDCGAGLKAEWLKKSQAVDLARREIREKLDALRDRARKPLTDWETAEEERLNKCTAQIALFTAAKVVMESDTSETVSVLLSALMGVPVEKDFYWELYDEAITARNMTATYLREAIVRMKQAEADKLELAKLRAATEAREEADREAARVAHNLRLAEELAEKARIADERRATEEKVRIEQAEKQAEERAKAEAERKAREAAEQLERERQKEAARIAAEHAAELEKERKLKETAERKLQEEAARIAKEDAARKAEEAREAAEAERKAEADRKLSKDKKHRAEVMAVASKALTDHCEIGAASANLIVEAIAAGKIPAVEIRFVP